MTGYHKGLIMDCVFTMATECKFLIGPGAPLPEIYSTGRLMHASHMDVDVCLT